MLSRAKAVEGRLARPTTRTRIRSPFLEIWVRLIREKPLGLLGACIVFARAADKGAVFDPSDVGGIGPRKIAVRPLRRIEPDQSTLGDHLIAQAVVFLARSIAPRDPIGTCPVGDLPHPRNESRMAHPCRRLHGDGSDGETRVGVIHGLDEGAKDGCGPRCNATTMPPVNGR